MTSVFRTRRTTDERTGGKILRGRRIAAAKTPYDRPIRAASPTRARSRQNPSWLPGFILPTSRLIASGATKLLSIFGPDSASSSDSDSCSEYDTEDETENKQIPFHGVKEVKETDGPASELIACVQKESQVTIGRSDVKHIIERLLMQETFSREECERLLQIINSRIIDSSTVEDGTDGRIGGTPSRRVCDATPDLCIKVVMEAKQWLEEKKAESILNSGLDHGTFTPNSSMLSQVAKDELGSPVDMAKLYMRARRPWGSPLNHLESRTPSPKGSVLFNQETQHSAAESSFLSSKKSYSTTSGSWNIGEEIRRVRSKATEDMLKTLPSSQIDMSSFALQPKSIGKSLVADKTKLDHGEKLCGLNFSLERKSMDAPTEVTPAPVLEVTQDGSWNEDLSSQRVMFPSTQNQDLEITNNLEGEERAASESHHVIIPEVAVDHDSTISGKTCSAAKKETELRSPSISNGFTFFGSSLPATDVGQSPGPSDGRNPSPSSSRQDESVNRFLAKETCELLSEASVEVPVLDEATSTSTACGLQNSLRKSQKLTQPNPNHDSATKSTGVEKQSGRRMSGYNRKRRGKA